ncbi:thiamine pyrophosphate-binding protein [Mesorhizobium sp. CA8]|uniref:thiamine pyrophosphate-binding protein n=1 Tax=unclassified Mesorhizobium TaxID=325217 RepID=UPI001CC9D80C|nr:MULTISPECIES: thiamine pyrophosphate-binding protein [unclassified Mesorhizobium]MBZ9761668.1 thiamine pyrophosphate-binding protein [Mesorhizobium sp. CA8]MBZ9820578.1 thiamine pyrophosphate-binding protein [Mesorhizobium sp. CA4]
MTRMTGARCLTDMLAGYGVTHIFMVPAVLRRSMAEMERRTSIDILHTHGEKAAAYMADGFARASGRVGVCMAQQTGALNLAAGLRDAYLARAPIVAFTGGSRPELQYRGLYQEAEDLKAFDPYVKFNAAINHVERFPDLVRQAFRAATTGNPGPVHLQVWGQEGEIDREEGDLDTVVEPRHASVTPFRPLADPALLQTATRELQKALRPVIIAGGGVHHSGAGAALIAFAERAGIPIAMSMNGRDQVPDNHPLAIGVVGTYSRRNANQAVAAADLVIFAGSSAGSMVTNFWRLPKPNTKTIQIDIDGAAIGRNYPTEIGIQADIRETFKAWLPLVPETLAARFSDWRKAVADNKESWFRERAEKLASDAVPIRPERICSELTRLLPDDGILCVDTGHAGMWMSSMFDIRTNTQTYIRSAGHLGWAFPAGLGAQCACPDRPVITFTGDLGLWYHIAEIETAVRKNIPAVTIVNNNRSGNQSMRGFSIAYEGKPTEKSRELWVHTEVDFARIAENMGAVGMRVDKPAHLAPAIEKAVSLRKPVVIDVVTDIEATAPLAWDDSGWVQKY